ncbi:MAG TPA: ATP synthase F1 subunit gamma [Planctomycetota bacterium]|nr:ATP synthase F1 subunit gamma [Planctomycetota bacterium]
MANPRALLKRRGSVTNTRKITKTMEMVATARLARAHQAAVAARPYARGLEELIVGLTADSDSLAHPLLSVRPRPKKAAVLVMTSDRGLCGAFNSNIARRARELRAELAGRGLEVEFMAHGRKAAAALKRAGWPVTKAYLGVSDKPLYARADEIGGALISGFLAGGFDEVHVVYSSFASRTAQVPCAEQLLPMTAPGKGASAGDAGSKGPRVWYLFHPGSGQILSAVLPLAVKNRVFSAMLETTAGEHAARRLAMKNATDAADEMIGSLTRAYNRARQYKITQEIAEIVGGVEAQG